MTRRTAPPAGPEQFARAFVAAALRLIHREAVPRTALRLVAALGGGWELWKLGDEPQLLAKQPRSSATLSDAALDLVRGAVSRLDVQGKAWLMQQMDGGRDEELPGAQPSHFQLALDLEDETWQLRVSAHARGGSVVVAELAGAVEQVQRAAA